MKTLTLSILTVLAFASSATAQTATPSIDCAPLDYQTQAKEWFDRGLCATAPKGAPARYPTQAPAPTATDVPTDAECANVNPYENGDLAARCSGRPLPPNAVPTFLVGHVYAFGYRELVARILDVGQDVDGVQFVVFRWLPESGSEGLRVERTPASAGGASNWTYVGR